MKNLLANWSNWKLILPAFLGFVYCIYLFQGAESKMSALAGEHTPMIDVRENYDLAEINDFFKKIKGEGREIHAHATGVVDMLFPFAYGLLFILLSAYFLKKITSPDSNWMYLSWLPVLLMIVDFIENTNTLNLLETYPNLTAEMVDSAAKVTSIKSALTGISMLMPIVLGVVWGGKWLWNKRK
ncbi:MAG: hypothetical protein AAGJ18_25285 [Bacteroidota bacterium]